jgi:uncharacterized membrane protein YeiH
VQDLGFPNFAANTPLWLALLTTFIGAVSGAIIGRTPGKVAYDIVGITVFAFFLGVGGGLTRDLLLGNLPPLALRTPWYIVTVLGAVLLVLIVGRWIPVNGRIFVLLDAMTLGLYAVIGAQMAIEFGLPDVGAIVVGFLASIAGGVIVAVLRRETPSILIPSQPYAILALIGTVIYVLLDNYNGGLGALLCVGSVIVLRFVTMNWNMRTRSVRPLEAGSDPDDTPPLPRGARPHPE